MLRNLLFPLLFLFTVAEVFAAVEIKIIGSTKPKRMNPVLKKFNETVGREKGFRVIYHYDKKLVGKSGWAYGSYSKANPMGGQHGWQGSSVSSGPQPWFTHMSQVKDPAMSMILIEETDPRICGTRQPSGPRCS